MTVRVLVHAEDALADAVARCLLDRAVHEEADEDWLRDLWAPEVRDHQRAFEDLSQEEPSSKRFRVHARDPRTNRALGGNAALAYRSVRHAAQKRGPNEDVLLLLAFDTDHRAARRCWEERAIDVLRAHGAQAGIPEFLTDVRREVPRCYRGARRPA